MDKTHGIHIFIMTSLNGNIFRVTGHLCGEFTGVRWRGDLKFSLICVWINGWVNNREAGGLRRYRAHYDVIVIILKYIDTGWHNQQSCFTTWSSDIRCIRKQGISIITCFDILMQKKWEFVQFIIGYNPNWHKILFWSNMNYVNRVIKPGGVASQYK